MLSNTFSDFISDVGATEHRHYDQQYKKKNWISWFSGMLFTGYVPLEFSYFARSIIF